MMTPILTLTSLTKTYDGVAALQDVNLSLGAGERVALLGHNGAGKSTLMKLVLGLIPATSGEIAVCGAQAGVARDTIAYLPENASFHPSLTGLEQLELYLSLRKERPSLAPSLLEQVGLGAAAHRRIGTYSKGMRQRVGLAQALIGAPQLLILDEPTSGLDPISRRDFYALLDAQAARGAAVLLSSHALTEVEARTDRILILAKGRLVAQGALAELRARADLAVTLALTPASGVDLSAQFPQAEPRAGQLILTCSQAEKLALLAQITALGRQVADLEISPPSLEDIYSHFSRRDGQ